MRALVIAVLIASSPAAATVRIRVCHRQSFGAKVLTPAGAVISPRGGLLVAAIETSAATSPGDDDIAARPGWRVRVGSRELAPAIRVLAPGLDVYDLGRLTGAIVFEDEDREELVRATAADRTVDLEAPIIASPRIGSEHGKRVVLATLDAPVPDRAVAVILYGDDGARSWAAVTPGNGQVAVPTTGGCGDLPRGTLPTRAGDEIRFAWVAESGRVSKRSAKVKVSEP